VLPLERTFAHKRLMLSRASPSAPIDPKHVRDAGMLGEVLGRHVPDVAHAAVAPDVYGVQANLPCERCELSRDPGWPLAPTDQIVELLGWSRHGKVTRFQQYVDTAKLHDVMG
jgi:hypothetical protein